MECFMTFEIWLTLFLASIAISVSPGAGAVLSMNYGINYGLKNILGNFRFTSWLPNSNDYCYYWTWLINSKINFSI